MVIAGFILKFGHEQLRPFVEDILKELEDAAKNIYSMCCLELLVYLTRTCIILPIHQKNNCRKTRNFKFKIHLSM